MYDSVAYMWITTMLMRLSRLLNGCTGGSFDEMFCSRVWRASYGRGRLVKTIDAVMYRIHGEREHCRNCTIYEFMSKANKEDDQ